MNIISWELTTELFTDITRDATITSFQDMVKLKNIQKSIRNIANIINKNGGWTIIGQVRKGFAIDKVTTDSINKEIIGAKNVSPHVISLSYTNELDDATKKLVAKQKFSMTKLTTEALTPTPTPNFGK